MKLKYLLSITLIFLILSTVKSQVTITFQVDVSKYTLNNTITASGIRIGGTFADQSATNNGIPMVNWTPSHPTSAMVDLGSNIWSIDVDFPASAVGNTFYYKYVNGNWGNNEGISTNSIVSGGCGVYDGSGNINRVFIIPAFSATISFCYDSCVAYCTTVPILDCNLDSTLMTGINPVDEVLPCIEIGSLFEQTLTFNLLDTISFSGNATIINWARIDSISGLPDGITWSCQTSYGNANCEIDSNEVACVKLSGITNDLRGQYKLGIFLTLSTSPLDSLPNVTAEALGFRYNIRVIDQFEACPPVDTSVLSNVVSGFSPYPQLGPSNNVCDSALILNVYSYEVNCDTIVQDIKSSVTDELWYEFTAPSNGRVVFLINPLTSGGVFGEVYDTCGNIPIKYFSTNNDYSYIYVNNLTAGNQYKIRVTSSIFIAGSIGFCIRETLNNEFCNDPEVTPVFGLSDTCLFSTGNTEYAFPSGIFSASSCDPIGPKWDLWYQFTVPPSGDIGIDLQDNSIKQLKGVLYTSCFVIERCLGKISDGELIFGLGPGDTMILQLYTLPQSAGEFGICLKDLEGVYSCSPPKELISSPALVTATLSWQQAISASSYIVKAAKLGLDSISFFNQETNTTSTTLSNLQTNTTYIWQVATICGLDTSNYSDLDTFMTDAIPICNKPNGLYSLPGYKSVHLSWIGVSGAVSYIIRGTKVGLDSTSFIYESSNTNSIILTDLLYNTSYYWQVASACFLDTSEYSKFDTFTTLGVPAEETIIGRTSYDLQTNRSIGRRIVNTVNGKILCTYTGSNSYSLAAPDRGSGYNSYNPDDKSWEHPLPVNSFPGRIENIRTGWPELVVTSSNREVVISHIPGASVNGLNVAYRNEAGNVDSPWHNMQITSDPNLSWVRACNCGDSIYVISSHFISSFNGVPGGIGLIRSFDGGLTWSGPDTIKGMNPSHFSSIGGDGYAIDCKGSKVAFVCGNFQTTLFTSLDAGKNWTKEIVVPVDPPLYGGLTGETLNTNGKPLTVGDQSYSILIDQNGLTHLWYGKNVIIDENPQGGWVTYVRKAGIMYWNENMSGLPSVIPQTELKYSYKCPPVFIPGNDLNSYFNSLVSMPSSGMDDKNNLYLVFASYESPFSSNGNIVGGIDPDGFVYRSTYALKSTDNGKTWAGPVPVNSNPGYEEAVFASLAKRVDSVLHIIYQVDEHPGTAALDALPGNPMFVDNKIVYKKLKTEEFDMYPSISSSANSNNATLSWNPVKNATSYTIRGTRLDLDSSTFVYLTTSDNSVYVESLQSNTSYYWQVSSQCEDSASDYSVFDTFTTTPVLCQSPLNLNETNVLSNSANLSWDPVPYASNYIIRGSEDVWDKTKAVYLTTANTTLSVSGLKPETTYFWQVQTACNNAGNPVSAFSALSSFTTIGSTASNKDLMSGESLSITVYPNPSDGHVTIELHAYEKEDKVAVYMYDLSGKETFTGEYAASEKVIKMNLEEGIYELILLWGDLFKRERIVVIE